MSYSLSQITSKNYFAKYLYLKVTKFLTFCHDLPKDIVPIKGNIMAVIEATNFNTLDITNILLKVVASTEQKQD